LQVRRAGPIEPGLQPFAWVARGAAREARTDRGGKGLRAGAACWALHPGFSSSRWCAAVGVAPHITGTVIDAMRQAGPCRNKRRVATVLLIAARPRGVDVYLDIEVDRLSSCGQSGPTRGHGQPGPALDLERRHCHRTTYLTTRMPSVKEYAEHPVDRVPTN